MLKRAKKKYHQRNEQKHWDDNMPENPGERGSEKNQQNLHMIRRSIIRKTALEGVKGKPML